MQFRPRVASGTVLLALLAAAGGVGQELVVGTLAGRPAPGYVDAQGRLAQFRAPTGLAQVGTVLFVADSGNHVIRQIDLATGDVSTLAGTGTAGYQDGPLAQAAFDTPRDVLHEPTWNALFVADSGNHVIRAIVLDEERVVTLAGTGTAGYSDGLADQAQFNEPSGLCLMPAAMGVVGDRPSQAADLLLVADTGNHCIRAVIEETPPAAHDAEAVPGFYVTTVAGLPELPGFFDGYATGAAQFQRPIGLALESPDRVLIADSENHAIRLYDGYQWYVSTIAGDGIPGDEDTPPPPGTQPARFRSPAGIAADMSACVSTALAGRAGGVKTPYCVPFGHVVADTGNHRLRAIDPLTSVVTTLAGTAPGYQDGPAAEALFHSPWAAEPHAVLSNLAGFISDRDNNCIRVLGFNAPPTADPGGPYDVGPAGSLTLDGTASSDPDVLLGDSISWAWDLNHDGVFDDAFGPLVNLDPVQVWRLFGTPDPLPAAQQAYVKTIGLEVTDLFGATDTATTTVTVTGDLAQPMTIQLLPEPQWTAGTENELEWTASAFAVGYQLEWSRLAGFAVILGNAVTPDLKATATGLKHNVTYYYRARALLSGGAPSAQPGVIGGIPGPWSNVESSTQDAVAPRSRIASPGSPFITRRPRVPLVVESIESGSGLSHEVLLYSHNGGPLTRYPGRYVPSSAVTDRGTRERPAALGIINILFDTNRAAGEGIYHLFAVGIDNVGNREPVGRTPDLVLVADSTRPVITRIAVLNVTPTSADVLWRTDEPTTGVIEYGETTAYGWAIIDPALARTHRAHLAGLDPDTVYHFRILARDRAQNVRISRDHVFRTREPVPSAPVLRREPTYTQGTTNTLSWSVAAPAARYRLEWDTDPTFPGPGALVTRNMQATARGLADGSTYFYRVAAINGDGVRGPWSNVEQSTQDASPPDSQVALAAVPTQAGAAIHLTPTSSDATSGVRYLLLYFAKDRGPFRRVGPRIPPTAGDVVFDATPYGGGHYAFYTRAVDRVGNWEDAPAAPDVEVDIKLGTVLEYVGDLGTTTGQPAVLAVLLTDAYGRGVRGAPISYTLGTLSGGLPPTDRRGFAQTAITVALAPGTYPLVLTFTGDATHLPSQAKADFVVKPLVEPPPAQRIEVEAEGAVVDRLGDRYQFRADVTNDPLGGSVVVRDVSRSRVFRATGLTSVTLSGDTAAITGSCSVDGAGAHRFVIWLSDATPDTFAFTTTDGTFVPQSALQTGAVTISTAP